MFYIATLWSQVASNRHSYKLVTPVSRTVIISRPSEIPGGLDIEHFPRRRQHLQHLVDDISIVNDHSTVKIEQETSSWAGLRSAAGGEIGFVCGCGPQGISGASIPIRSVG